VGHQPWSLPGISLSRCCLCWWSPLHIKHTNLTDHQSL
jgi:hypothetical protein